MLLFALSILSANPVKVHPIDSSIHEAITSLYIAEGLSLPSTAAPWSSDELSLMLSRLDEHSLSLDSLDTYRYVVEELKKDLPPFSLKAQVAGEVYLHTDTTSFTDNEDWIYNYEDRKPVASVPMEISLADFFYAFIAFDLANGKYDQKTSVTTGTSTLFGKYHATSNFFHFWRTEDELVIDANIPYLAFGALGGKSWLLEIGRDKLSWGPGTTGNFMLGDHLQYHNQGRFTAYSDSFKYTFVTSFFPHPEEIWNADQDDLLDMDETKDDPGSISSIPSYSQARPLVGLKLFMAHRFEWRLFNDKVGLSLSEGIMYQSPDGDIDLRILNPFMLYHNYFIRSNANSMATMELDYAFSPSWNLYGEMVVDELSFGSTEANLTSGRHPDGVGLMLGLKMAKPYKGGMLYGSLEGVRTDPYLYLRSLDGDADQTGVDDTLNFVVAIRRWLPDTLIYDQSYMGYEYGGDAYVGSLVVGYKRYGEYALQGNLFYMAHGQVSMDTNWERDKLSDTPTGEANHYIDIGFTASIYLTPSWEAYAGLDWLAKIEHYVPSYDVQFMFGIQYAF